MTDAGSTTHSAGESPRARPVSPGDTLAGRYHVVRLIAEGGMGSVYEAKDLVLGETVALKTLRPEISRDATTLARFRREIRLAHRISHRNVCRIYDVFEHVHGDEVIPFLTMELVEGETLATLVRRDGPFDPTQALPVALQLCQALAAAHEAEVVHRDLKSQNVLLAVDRAVIADFGLARSPDREEDTTVTREGTLLGTPAYMAPEQVQGKNATSLSDIYSLGVVLYEMVTGRLPFEATTALSVATKRLHQPPVPPRHRRPDLPARWEAAILRCLALDPSARFASATDLARALRGELRPRRAWVIAAAVAIASGLVAAGHVTVVTPVLQEAQPARTSVAVIGLKNLSGEAQVSWLATAMAETLEATLAVNDEVRTIPGEEVAIARRDLGLHDVDALGRETLARVARRLGADVVASGSYLVFGGEVRIHLRLQRTSNGQPIGSPITETGSEKLALEVIDRAARRVRVRLGLADRDRPGGLPTQPEAARLYAEAVNLVRAFDPIAARDRLQQAARLEPGAALVHVALADAAEMTDNRADAAAALSRAMDAAAQLPRAQQAYIDARLRLLRGGEGAAELLEELHATYPDDPRYTRRYVEALIAAGKLETARQVIERNRTSAGDAVASLSLGEVEAALLAEEGGVDSDSQVLTAALRNVSLAKQLGGRRLAAFWLAKAAWRSVWLGDLGRAEELLLEARELAAQVGDAGVYITIDQASEALALRSGCLAEARAASERQLAVWRARRDPGREMVGLHNVAFIHLALGDHAGAERLYRDAMQILDGPVPTGRPDFVSRVKLLTGISGARFAAGDLEAALELLEEAERLLGQGGHEELRNTFRSNRVRIFTAGDRLDAAREEARRVLESARPDSDIRRKMLPRLARLELAAGRLDEAARVARGAADAEPAPAFRARAGPLATLLRVRLEQDDLPGARRVAAELTPILLIVEEHTGRSEGEVALALLRAREGDVAGARRALLDLIGKERRDGHLPVELEARLALARLAGPGTQALRAALERDAASRGFRLIARQAARRP